jgi:hypothetical protein
MARVRIAQIFSSAPPRFLLHCVDPEEVLHPGSHAPVSRERMRGLMAEPAPVIWIGGSEPLVHPGIGHFVRAIGHGHYVFLETDGTLLRRRIHEFEPGPQVFLTVRLDSRQATMSSLAVEGLRAARLSGFFTVVHSLVQEDAAPVPLGTLRRFIKETDVDGWLITAASGAEAAVRKAAEARGMIPSGFWRQFSEHVEEAILAQAPRRELHATTCSAAETPRPEAREQRVSVT